MSGALVRPVIPAKAGTQANRTVSPAAWAPAFAGVTALAEA
ncbi:MAG TPA: hypothetical protein VIJ55_03420 [Acetobacteraceae bacterium]